MNSLLEVELSQGGIRVDVVADISERGDDRVSRSKEDYGVDQISDVVLTTLEAPP